MRTEMEIQQENIKKLIELVQENPDLRIVPMVDTECVLGDDFSYWIANWGKAEIDEIWSYEGGETLYSKSNSYDILVEESMDNNDIGEEEAKEIVSAYDWEKVITVSIQPYA